jgi:hypothetical protein
MSNNKFSELDEDYVTVNSMMTIAADHGLESEVVWTFYQLVKDNPEVSVAEAAADALSEWDI